MKTLWGFFKKEMIALLRDPVMLMAILIMPVVQVIIFSQAITMEAKNLRLAIDLEPNDYMMERIYDHAIGSGWFTKVNPSPQSAIDLVQSGKADVALIAPSGGLTKALGTGDAQVQVLIDATNVLKAQSIDSYLQGITAQVFASEFNQKLSSPIGFSLRILFNPQLDTQLFLIPAIMAVLVLMSLLTLVSISITKEKETGTIETLISAPISKYDIILGKTVPYILIALLNMFIIQIVAVILFHLPFNGSFLMFMLSFICFVLPSCAVGVWLSTYTQTQQQAMLGLMIVLFLALMLSGALFPIENMPLVLQFVSYLNPLTHYIFLVRNILLKGSDWTYFAEHAAMMLLVGAFIAWAAVRRFKTTL